MEQELRAMVGKRVLLRQSNTDGWLEMRGTLHRQPKGGPDFQLNAEDCTKFFTRASVVQAWAQEDEGEGIPQINIR